VTTGGGHVRPERGPDDPGTDDGDVHRAPVRLPSCLKLL
jgi:hypothetical protein